MSDLDIMIGAVDFLIGPQTSKSRHTFPVNFAASLLWNFSMTKKKEELIPVDAMASAKGTE